MRALAKPNPEYTFNPAKEINAYGHTGMQFTPTPPIVGASPQ